MLELTEGIVLKSIKYGDTSLIVTVFTEKLGLQTYLIKGVRTGKSGNMKSNLLFSSSILEMVVYKNPHKNLQTVKEFRTAYFYQHLSEHIIKNGIAVFAMEVLLQLLISDDIQYEIYEFSRNFLIDLDKLEQQQLANMPIFFLIQIGELIGYKISGDFSINTPYLDLGEGKFSETAAQFPPYIDSSISQKMSELNRVKSVEEVVNVKISNHDRKVILGLFIQFFQMHTPYFKNLKSMAVLSAILN